MYTVNEIIEMAKGEIGKSVCISTITKYMNDNRFYERGLAFKESNGFELNDGNTGKKWLITEEGKDELFKMISNKNNRRTKAEIEKARGYVKTTQQIKSDYMDIVNGLVNISNLQENDVFNQLLGGGIGLLSPEVIDRAKRYKKASYRSIYDI